jgi:CubicO group peptidase (beta-lactamase class C family)
MPPRSSVDSRCVGGGLLTVLLVSAAVIAASPVESSALEPARLARFDRSLERLRQQLKIPGLSAAIVSEGRLAWARGFGHADRERGIVATPDTPYHLASVAKPFAAVLVLQLVDEGLLDLDDPVSDYGLDYQSPGVIRVRHLLSHTSRGEPGMEFSYDSDRFADLGWLVARASGRSFRQLLADRILTPLGLANTAPTPLSMGDGVLSPFRTWLDPRNARVYARLARPYALDRSFAIIDGHHPIIFSPSSGLLSSASDLARFDIAVDGKALLPEAAKARMFRPTVTPDGRRLPYGLGWFSQTHNGTRLVWHYGWNPPTASALYLRLPDEGLTLIVLANTDALSRPFDLGRGDTLVLESTVALIFYEIFVLEARRGRSLPRIDWEADEETLVHRLQASAPADEAEMRERELLSYRRLFHSVGRADLVERLDAVHRRVYPLSPPVGDEALPTLGEHLLPWPSVPLFSMGHVTAFAWFLLVIFSSLALWLVRSARDVFRRRPRPGQTRGTGTCRITTALAALCILGGTALYVVILSRWPQTGPVTWSDGRTLARGLIATAAAGGVLAAGVVVQTVARWRGGMGPLPGRLQHTAVASGILAGAWALLDLVGWL